MHKKGEKSEEEREQEASVISLNYMGRKTKDEWSQRAESSPTIVGIKRYEKGVFSHMVPRKGVDAHAIKIVQEKSS